VDKVGHGKDGREGSAEGNGSRVEKLEVTPFAVDFPPLST
jgi:hypothetical protein